ncbi:MAG TPA: GGDEF domain-containing response regulator [Candidatus Dormibacteraeota bacterium]
MARRPLRLLILEDREEDAELALRELRNAGFEPNWRRVEDEAGFRQALDPELDLILADYHQPSFDALKALKLMHAANLDVPFVIFSGAVGEDSAVAAVRQGAMDYVLKDRLARLGTAVTNALEQAELRRRQKLARAALEHQALHDALTDLPNRLMLRQELERTIMSNQTPLALLLLDVDNFKEINDSFGHAVGDALLRQIGPRLSEALDGASMVARLGGDEFAILLPKTGADMAAAVAHRVLRGLERPFLSEDHALELTASIGIAVYPPHGLSAEVLLQKAEVAMYAAKRNSGSYAIYRAEDDPFDPSRVALRADLRKAIERREIVLYYQPQASLTSGEITGLEALARWQHPVRGWVPPNVFIPIAERMGLIKPLTSQLLDLAASDSAAWAADRDIPVAVNVSMRNLTDARFPHDVEDAVHAGRVASERLKLEITETAIMADPGRVLEAVNRLRTAGFRFAIDDFGTGYSSLTYLQKLPVEEIKIDRSFISQLLSDQGSAAIVRATIELAGSLGLDVVAEGVEDEETWRQLAQLGCSAAQGYYLSRPMPAASVPGWLTNRRRPQDSRQAA